MRRSDTALIRTAQGVGPGILTGAVTTSIAFFAAGLTEFTGVAELGIIAGGGILLCCLAAMTVLPAILQLSDARRPGEVLPAPLDIHGWLGPLFARPRLLLVVTLGMTAGFALGMTRLEYDHNLLNLQPEGLESVELEKKLLSKSDQSVWFALSVADSREDLLAMKQKFLDGIESGRIESVQRIEEIASLIPADLEQ
jgi:predicted RND superfamily exporter protein